MKTSAIIRIVIYSFIALLLTAVMIFGIVAGNGGIVSFGSLNFSKEEPGFASTATPCTITADIKEVKIEWTAGDVILEKGTGNAITFSETADYEIKEGDELRYRQQGDTLEIHFAKSTVWNFFGTNNVRGKTLTVTLPDTLYRNLSVETVSSAVTVIGLQADKMDIETVSGGISLDGTAVGELDCESVSGKTEVNGTITRSASFDSVSGGITLSLPQDTGFTAELDSVSGSFSSDFETTKQGDEYRCGLGGIDLSFETVSGNVEILVAQ